LDNLQDKSGGKMKLDLQTSQFIALALLGGIVLVLWLRAKKLQTRLEQVTQAVLQLVNESEKANKDLRQSVAKLETRNATAEAVSSIQNFADSTHPEDFWDIDRRHRVMTLAKHGLSTGEIAQRLSLPDGEIQLMLNMAQQMVN